MCYLKELAHNVEPTDNYHPTCSLLLWSMARYINTLSATSSLVNTVEH